MRALVALLRDVVWPAVIAAVLAPLGVLLALLRPETPALGATLGLAAVTFALLASRG